MKRKILIAGGRTSFKGPWINLEEGVWLVEPPSTGKVKVMLASGKTFIMDGKGLEFQGPIRLKGIVVESEEDVHLDVVEIG